MSAIETITNAFKGLPGYRKTTLTNGTGSTKVYEVELLWGDRTFCPLVYANDGEAALHGNIARAMLAAAEEAPRNIAREFGLHALSHVNTFISLASED